MDLKEYKETNNISNRDLTAELKKVQPELDEPLVSRMVKGVVRPSQAVEDYIASKTLEKVFANTSAGFSEGASVDVSTFSVKDLKTPFLQQLYLEIAKGSMWAPATRQQLCHALNANDRAIRAGIEDLRNSKVKVISFSDRHGYWLNDGYAKFRRQMLAKAYTIIRTIRRMDGITEGQLEWVERLG